MASLFFDSADALLPRDTNGAEDVYEYENGNLSLISTGESAEDSYFIDASASGSDVFFTTAQQLMRIDTDDSYDLYDARVDGGIPAQNASPPAECQGDACQTPATAPIDETPGTADFSGSGNFVAPPTPVVNHKIKRKAKARKRKKIKHRKKSGKATAKRGTRR